MAIPRPKSDGTEGTATVEMKYENGKNTPKFYGCIVKNDANLWKFIENDIKKPAKMEKFKSTKYFFYTCDPDFTLYLQETNIKNCTSCTVTCHRFSNPSQPKSCEIKWSQETNNFVKVQEHIFLPICDAENFNSSTFLINHAKNIQEAPKNLTKVIYGLSYEKEKRSPKFIKVELNQKSSNGYGIGANCYKKLEDAGPVLLKDGKTVVGSLKKKGNDEISISIFGIINQDGTGQPNLVSSLSAPENEQAPPNPPADNRPSGTGQTAGTQPPAPEEGTGQAASTQPSDGIPVGVEQQDAPPHNTHYPTEVQGDQQPDCSTPNPPEGDAVPEPLLPNPPEGDQAPEPLPPNPPEAEQAPAEPLPPNQQVLADLFGRKTSVLDGLCLRLDNDYKVIENWRHLADHLKAPKRVKDSCECGTKHSPTELLLEVPKVSSVTIAHLLQKLREMRRNDVVDKIADKISEADRNKTVDETLMNDYELCDEVALLLDKNSGRLNNNWRRLGQKLDVSRDDLDQIGRGLNNPANELFLYAYTTLEPEKLKAGYFRSLTDKFPDRNDVKDYLDTLGVTLQDDRSIKDVFQPESDNLRDLCSLLNRNVGGIRKKDWKYLASGWEIEYETYNSFDDTQKPKPTKILLEDWLIQARPGFTVEELRTLLEEMKRNDVREYLEKEARG